MRTGQLTAFSILLKQHLRRNALSLSIGMLAMGGYTAAELLSPWPLKIILDNVVLGKPVTPSLGALERFMRLDPKYALAIVASGVLLIGLLKAGASYLQVFLTSRVGYEMVHTLRSELFAHLHRLSLSFHHRARTGELLAKITADTNVLKDVFASGLLEVLSHALTLTGMCLVLATLNRKLALVVLFTLPVLAATIFSIYRRGKASARRQREREGEVAAHIGEVLQLTPLVRAFARERAEQERFDRQSSRTLDESVRTARTEAAAGRLIELINAAGVCSVLFLGGLLAVRREITPGELLIFASYLSSMYKPLRSLAKLSIQFSKAMASVERIDQLLAAKGDAGETLGGVDPGPLRGDIEFKDVHFAYIPEEPVLRAVSFRIRVGEHVAIVGSSGSGKSTVANLLLRFYSPQQGLVQVDGHDLQTLDGEAYRRQIGVVLQDSLLFGATIAENIAYGAPGVTRAEIECAARLAVADGFVSALPDGYDTVLTERATILSGGQRQRLCLARALIKQPSLLILDEPTSAIDAGSTALIHRAVAELQRGKTTIVIAHQFHGMDRFDRIIVLKDGTVAEQGTHEQLLARQRIYWELFHLQGLSATCEVEK
jgi:ATP-binding cassette subfamily B protein/subfamily B ATP-binding cassette protein MsbA